MAGESKPAFGLLLSSAQAEATIFKNVVTAIERVYEWSKPYGHYLTEPSWNSHYDGGRWVMRANYWDTNVWPKNTHQHVECVGETIGLLFIDAETKLMAVAHEFGRLAPRASVSPGGSGGDYPSDQRAKG